MPAAVNSFQIASGMLASGPMTFRGAAKNAALVVPAIANGSAYAFTLQGYVGGPAHGDVTALSSAAAFWANIHNAWTGSLVTFTTAGPLAVAMAEDVIKHFDALRVVMTSAALAPMAVLVHSKP